MKIEQKGNLIPIIAGAAFLLLALDQLLYLQNGFSFTSLSIFAIYAALAVLLFMKNRSILLCIPIAFIVLFDIRELFYSLMNMYKYNELYNNDFLITITIVVGKLFSMLASLTLFLLISIALINALSKYKENVKQFWFLPACLIAVPRLFYLFRGSFFLNFLYGVIVIVAYALVSMWIAYTDGFPTENYQTNGRTIEDVQVIGNAYCDLVKHILLLLFTFGIYYLIWIYRTTAYLNCVEDEPPRNPTSKLLLCMFVPFYSIYWIYKSAQRIDRLAGSKGVDSDIITLCLILAIFVGIIPPILMQEKMNTIANVENGTVTPQTHNATMTTTPNANIGTVEELKKYKELLDSGVITQSEFDAKKKQLLGL